MLYLPAQMSLFATTSAAAADGERPSAISSESIDEITLSPKSPTPALCISAEKTTTTKTQLSSPDAWAEVEAVDATGEDGSAACTDDAEDEVARLRSENKSLMSQVTQLHALLQEHAVLVETAAAEISPSLRKPQPATPDTWWVAATRTFRSVQSDEAVRATEKQAVKTAADAARTAAEAAAEGATDGALAAIGHRELAPAVDRLIDANADIIEDEVVAYADRLIDASVPSRPGTPGMNTDISDVGKSDTFSDGEAGSTPGPESAEVQLVAAPDLSSSLLPKWSQVMVRPASNAGWFAVGAVASLAARPRHSCKQMLPVALIGPSP